MYRERLETPIQHQQVPIFGIDVISTREQRRPTIVLARSIPIRSFETLPLPVIARQPEHNRFKATVSSSDIPETELSIGACALVGRFLLDSPPAARVPSDTLPPSVYRPLSDRTSISLHVSPRRAITD